MLEEEQAMLKALSSKIVDMVTNGKCLDDNSITAMIDNYLKLKTEATKTLDYTRRINSALNEYHQ